MEGIRKARKKAGLTQRELADKLHVSLNTVSRWEVDSSKPHIDMLTHIAEALGCKVEYLVASNPQ